MMLLFVAAGATVQLVTTSETDWLYFLLCWSSEPLEANDARDNNSSKFIYGTHDLTKLRNTAADTHENAL